MSASALPRPSASGADTTAGDHAHEASRLRRLAASVRPELALLIAVAAFLNVWNLSVSGDANTYYSAAVKSMSHSWSAFLWGTFDPAGLMTVDKPPLALWVQAASVRIFGYSSWAMLAPQALMGIASVALTYDLTRRVFGRAAGFVGGLALALTPTAVAVFRHNNPDAALMLCIVVALWAVVRGLQDGRTRWLVIAGAAIGLGFTAKMGAALLVVPGLIAAWLWVRPEGGFIRAIKQLLAFGASAAVVGLAWPVAVWLTPAADRPWISGTSDNSIWSLILGYNGLGRLLGQSGGPGGTAGGPGGGAGGGGGMFGGTTGPLRLLNESLGSQGGWLLGMAIGAGVLILVASRLRRSDPRTGWLIATGGAFATTAVAFSYASGIFHPYYVSALAPFTAALVGGGFGTMLALAKGQPGGSAERAPVDRLDDAPVGGAPIDAAVTADSGVRSAVFAGPAGAVPARLWDDRIGDPQVAGATDDADGGSAVDALGAKSATRRLTESTVLAAIAGAMLVAGAATEAAVLNDATQLGWLTPVLFVGTIAAAGTLLAARNQRARIAAVSAAMALLLFAPGVWSAQTLSHSVGSTFPTGGPSGSGGIGGPGGGMGRGPGGMGGFRGGGAPPWAQGSGSSSGSGSPQAGGFPGMPPGAPSAGSQGALPSAPSAGSSSSPGALPGAPSAGSSSGSSSSQQTSPGAAGGPMSGAGGGGMFGGDQTAVKSALAYAKANGGGTVVVSGQMGAATSIISSDANIAGVGGFSGRESEVSVDWFADRVASGEIRWAVTSSGGLRDSRTGSNTVMGAVSSTCKAVASVSGLYDCQGKASALRSAAN